MTTQNANLYSLLRSRFADHGEACCLELADGRCISYDQVDQQSGRMAGALTELGVKPGDRVLVQTDKSLETVILYLACLRTGAVFLPLNTAYTASEIRYFMNDASPVVAVCRPQNYSALSPIARAANIKQLLTLGTQTDGSLMDYFTSCPDRDLLVPRQSHDLASIIYTSGTTGHSKGAMLSHGNLASNALVLHAYWGWGEGDVLLHALPIFHVHGLFVALHCAFLNASPVLFLNTFNTDTVLERLPRATVMMGVPTFYVRLLACPEFDRQLVASMRLFISGSAPLLEETFHRFEQRTGHRILERYGMSEAGMITSNPLDGERLAGTVGYLLPGHNGRVVDEQGQKVPRGTPGILEITGPNVFNGYWQMPKKTAREFRSDGYFITGDIATMAEDGRISIVGRGKDLVISGGYNVYPKEIELLIDDMPGVLESAVIGLPHADFGEAVTAIVVSVGDKPLDEQQILQALDGKLARFKQPKRVFFVDQLPRNTMGKIQKNQLRDHFNDTYR
ncbi:MAG TPA: malonyl-CoA synthase [Gammaproteobacteria bacterium]|nr:malonyl-CoA synthase [Gammaproteobacteria bacterium]